MSRLFFMISRLFVLLTLLLVFLTASVRGATGCLGVKGEWVTAGDFASIVPEFTKLDPAESVLSVPSGLSRRWLSAAGIAAIAYRVGVGSLAVPNELCLEQVKKEIRREQILEQIKSLIPANGDPGEVLIELLNYFPKQTPSGVLRFEFSGLAPSCTAGGCGLYRWRGAMLLDAGGSILVTAEVRIEIIGKGPIAERDLPTGTRLGAQDFSIIESRRPWLPSGAGMVLNLSGYIVQRPLKTGESISSRSVRKPLEVEKGELVELHVNAGQMELITQAKAETSGKAGDRVVVSNPVSHRRFMAEVTGPGRARTISKGDNQ